MKTKAEILLIGGSAGSLKVLLEVFPDLSQDILFPIIIILHRKPHPDAILNKLLENYTQLPVFEAEDKMTIENGCVYVVPPDYHLLFEDKKTVSLDSSEKLNYSRPSIDVTFKSAAEVFKENAVALLLSGANADGVMGLKYIKRNNGTTLVQDPETSDVEYMPRQAILHATIDSILKPSQIAGFINQLNV
ncbi:chemotaxis protein CheB [Pseudoxanthomonas sp. SGD-10]|nr:chemotaxis protein CheB [Pseudoxanthomonas sp. SGD-10]